MTGGCETLIQKNLTEGDKEHFKINSLNNEQGISGDDRLLENRKKPPGGVPPKQVQNQWYR